MADDQGPSISVTLLLGIIPKSIRVAVRHLKRLCKVRCRGRELLLAKTRRYACGGIGVYIWILEKAESRVKTAAPAPIGREAQSVTDRRARKAV